MKLRPPLAALLLTLPLLAGGLGGAAAWLHRGAAKTTAGDQASAVKSPRGYPPELLQIPRDHAMRPIAFQFPLPPPPRDGAARPAPRVAELAAPALQDGHLEGPSLFDPRDEPRAAPEGFRPVDTPSPLAAAKSPEEVGLPPIALGDPRDATPDVAEDDASPRPRRLPPPPATPASGAAKNAMVSVLRLPPAHAASPAGVDKPRAHWPWPALGEGPSEFMPTAEHAASQHEASRKQESQRKQHVSGDQGVPAADSLAASSRRAPFDAGADIQTSPKAPPRQPAPGLARDAAPPAPPLPAVEPAPVASHPAPTGATSLFAPPAPSPAANLPVEALERMLAGDGSSEGLEMALGGAPATSAPQALETVAPRADELIRQGAALALRGAHYSARLQFIQALRLISQALDASAGEQKRGQALLAGLRALREADDFTPKAGKVEAELNLAALVASHRTPVLRGADLARVTPLVALQQYYLYAQEQLALAARGAPQGSEALYGLGKLQTTLADSNGASAPLAGPQAMAFHQAALMAHPGNYLAANEMGVLLARYGQYQDARGALLQCLATAPLPEAWHNLAEVHERLGERELASLARREFELARQGGGGRNLAAGPVRWVSPAEMQRVGGNEAPPPEATTRAPGPPAAHAAKQTPAPPAQARQKNSWWSLGSK